MEVLEIQGYTEEEKLRIARDHLVSKQILNHGLHPDEVTFTDEALRAVIRGYTREAGVRNLERELGAICRKLARRRAEAEGAPAPASPAAGAPPAETPSDAQPGGPIQVREAEGPAAPEPDHVPAPAGPAATGAQVVVTAQVVEELLGAPRHRDEEMKDRTRDAGVAIGLAWTPVGGDVLFVEASRMAGSSALTITGSLGDVMKESARIALSWFRAHAPRYGVDPTFYKDAEIHLHVPSGAIPKDGPSAGVTMVTALASALSGRPVRGDLAMTGEITLSGRVLPVGGIKEKVLAARRAGLRQVILPRGNEKDVREDLSDELRQDLVIHYAEEMDDVLRIALQPVPAARASESPRPDEIRPRFSLA
jgi:ATP-dependent Lon protease